MLMIEKYQTVPVTKEAVQWNGQNFDEIKEFTHGDAYYHDSEGLFIRTLEGPLRASVGDFIIKGLSGEFYACKPDIFKKTYLRIDDRCEVDCTYLYGSDAR